MLLSAPVSGMYGTSTRLLIRTEPAGDSNLAALDRIVLDCLSSTSRKRSRASTFWASLAVGQSFRQCAPLHTGHPSCGGGRAGRRERPGAGGGETAGGDFRVGAVLVDPARCGFCSGLESPFFCIILLQTMEPLLKFRIFQYQIEGSNIIRFALSPL
jgi:hypothetical protein